VQVSWVVSIIEWFQDGMIRDGDSKTNKKLLPGNEQMTWMLSTEYSMAAWEE
jgi:hypothetical protein